MLSESSKNNLAQQEFDRSPGSVCQSKALVICRLEAGAALGPQQYILWAGRYREYYFAGRLTRSSTRFPDARALQNTRIRHIGDPPKVRCWSTLVVVRTVRGLLGMVVSPSSINNSYAIPANGPVVCRLTPGPPNPLLLRIFRFPFKRSPSLVGVFDDARWNFPVLRRIVYRKLDDTPPVIHLSA